MKLTNQRRRIFSGVRKATPHGLTCPYEDCQGPIRDLFSEWVEGYKLVTDCYYCLRPVRYAPKGHYLVKTDEDPVSRSVAKMKIWTFLAGRTLEETIEDYKLYREDGKRAFENYPWES